VELFEAAAVDGKQATLLPYQGSRDKLVDSTQFSTFNRTSRHSIVLRACTELHTIDNTRHFASPAGLATDWCSIKHSLNTQERRSVEQGSHMSKGDISFSPTGESLSIHFNSADHSLSSSTMGHSNVTQHHYQNSRTGIGSSLHFGSMSERSPLGTELLPGYLADEKTMDQTIATVPTQFTDLGGAGGHGEEDDTTTIHSLDSVSGAVLLNIHGDNELHSSPRSSANIRPSLSVLHNDGAVEASSSVCSVSTAPSTDEASSIGPDWANYSSEPSTRPGQHQTVQHRRLPSWEASPYNQQPVQPGGRISPAAFHLPPAFSPPAWSNGGNQNHVANQQMDNLHNKHSQVGRLSATANQWNHSHAAMQTRYESGRSEPALPFLPQAAGRNIEATSPRGLYHRQQMNVSNYAYPTQHLRKPYSQPPLPPSAANTPPRMGATERPRNQVQHNSLNVGHSPHRSTQTQHGSNIIGGGGSSRSSSEVLKTLLRKKACLYEPDTSRAVALVTWLVGRELALEFGFFSRQQLQAGVHACVSGKIESGVITRTKVNRCMQIILNSCFHYIIPRSDGSEESGDTMRDIFSREMKNDSFLLSILPPPWNDILINRQEILAACEEEMEMQKHHKKYETPHSSPRLTSVQAMGSPGGGESLEGENDSKRAVLLCFNENVRSAEEVFRCHNEFIRDTAHACHLQLSSNEWRLFFGREAASARYLWGNVGIPVPYLEDQGPQHTDALGVLIKEEVGVFRTSWCSKRYDHEHELCGFGHAEVNGGWLRRNPMIHEYTDELCHFVASVPINTYSSEVQHVIINECPHGRNCPFAHSHEEIIYHPQRYKQRSCTTMGRPGGCLLGDVCPGFHPIETYRFPKKSDSRSARFARQSQAHSSPSMDKGLTPSSSSAWHPLPHGSPILYASPAPMSSYEQHLLLPGLKCLFRRQSAAVRANLQHRSTASTDDGAPTKILCYNCFGDDVGLTIEQKLVPSQVVTSSNSSITRPQPLPSFPQQLRS
jgi:hypothetical protein